MKEQELKNVLDNVEISEEIQNRISEKIQKAYSRKESNYMKSKKKFVITAVAATLALGITAFAATYMNWSNGFLSSLNISKSQMEKLQNSDNPLVAMPEVSDAHDGITVSTAQCLFDGNVIHLSFYVEGYELDPAKEPELKHINVLFDGEQAYNYDWYFFNGIDWTDRENPVMADGTPVNKDENGNLIPNYRIAGGKMEIDLNLTPVDENGNRISEADLKEKMITVIMRDFGDITGQWTLEWNLGSFEKGTEFTLNKELGNSNAKVTSAVLYSASAIINYDFPQTVIQSPVLDETGQSVETSDFAEPPAMVGVKLKDGTIYTDLQNGGTAGYENADTDEFTARINFSRIIDVDEIDSLLFLKGTNDNAERNITEDDCYAVTVK
ncbi:MAG: hypothetical protein J1F64_06205 [Oscillospiraceae bacterium]|nr:hypothetical protein [Oscillospiraceae bacterium]